MGAADRWVKTKTDYDRNGFVVIPDMTSQKDIIFALLCFEMSEIWIIPIMILDMDLLMSPYLPLNDAGFCLRRGRFSVVGRAGMDLYPEPAGQ